ncbi:D-alanyl-D-alanine carboxypeptidase family protein [Inmirania thermothiophila]|uniref:serine-type D-Ala-D-Ala carboxypeptidase n=1 Tax=Inmirania thermothiophila TaxID=1750597 RepID=A0A3N1Y789_9GAMM|nr:D-alanyl-D-alanine carboxypeptidase family protein [Inmirania thermothiophila]ROR34684.1 penicillin-binding protein 6 [Inmirania thermothiophila]
MPAIVILIALVAALAAPALRAAAPPVPAPPALEARSYLLMDFDSGRVLAAREPEARVEPASITKVMTTYVVLREIAAGRIRLDDAVTVSEKAWRTPGSRMFIEVGTKVTVRELLMGLIVQSGNDASVALAEQVAGTEAAFADLMNRTAAELGLTGSHFVNATGLPDPEHYMTARDIALLARALIRDFPREYAWFKERVYEYNGIRQYNRNRLLWRDGSVDGIKTGHTESAGYSLVASARRGPMRLISVVLGTRSDEARTEASQALLNYGFRFFETHRLYAAGKPLTEARVWKGARPTVGLGLAEDLYVTIPRGAYEQLEAEMALDGTAVTAPARKGQRLGTVRVRLGGETLAERPLVALADVPLGGLAQRLIDEVRLWFQ